MTVFRRAHTRSAMAIGAGLLLAAALGARTAPSAFGDPAAALAPDAAPTLPAPGGQGGTAAAANNAPVPELEAPEVQAKLAPDLADACRQNPGHTHRVIVQF